MVTSTYFGEQSRETFMGELTRPERLQIMLTAEEIAAIDDWRFARRMPTRAAAVREILRRGLAAEGMVLAEAGRHSRSFGVIEKAANRRKPS
jgi:hypothetical protein